MTFITMCGTIRSLKSAYAGSFIFDLYRKFLGGFCCQEEKNIFLGLMFKLCVPSLAFMLYEQL
jgi:hypothetical protein